MTAPTQAAPSLHQTLALLVPQARERAALLGRPVLVSLAQSIDWPLAPLVTFAAGKRLGVPRIFWGRPADRFWLVGLGQAAQVAPAGPAPARQAQDVWRSLVDGAVLQGPRLRGVGPLLMGGFRFDPTVAKDALWGDFPDALLALPHLMFTWEGGRTWLTVNMMVGPFADLNEAVATTEGALESLAGGDEIPRRQPASSLWDETLPEEWRRRMEAALQAIDGRELSKVVLARRKELRAVAPFSLEATLGSLEEAYPGCAMFAVERGGSCFLGASPESLMQLHGGELSLTCMAGTAARSESADADDSLAGALLSSSKERREHAAVVEQVTLELRDLCQELCWEAQPKVVRLRGVQHLATAFFGRALEGKDILDMVAALHPTPAVGGAPKAAALEVIRRLEGDRGWYAAPIGWLDAQGQGEFWVGIRSALVQGSQATLYAGAGIVEGSNSLQEEQETELKFQPLLKALGQA